MFFEWLLLDYEEFGHDEFSFGNRTVANGVDKDGPVLSKLGSSSTTELHPKDGSQVDSKPTNMPPTSVMTRLILIMVWRKLIRNPNTYSSLIGLIWSLVCFKYVVTFTFMFFDLFYSFVVQVLTFHVFVCCRWNVVMPAIVAKSIAILSDAGLGMAMFSLGIFLI